PTRYTDPQGLCIGPLALPCLIIAENGPAIAAGVGVVAEIITGTPNPVSSAASFPGRAAQALTHDVYLGMKEGEAAYVGISSDLARRTADWAKKYDIQGITSCKVTKDQARGIEQAMINRNPGFDNKINSISPKRDWYQDAVSWGEQWLREHGF
ncbi:type IV secretion protein Rhs, partial [Ralstonia solanacearum species complex bacterium KE055]